MQMKLPQTPQAWLTLSLWSGLCVSGVFVVKTAAGLNIETFIQDHHWDRLWALPWGTILQPFNHLVVWMALGAAACAGGLLTLQIDRRLRRGEQRPSVILMGAPPAADALDLVSVEDAGRWLYNHGSEKLKTRLTNGVGKSGYESIADFGASLAKDGAMRAALPIYGRREVDLEMEEIDPAGADFTAFEAVFGADRRLAVDLSVKRSDLPTLLAVWEELTL